MTADFILNHQGFLFQRLRKKSKKMALENKFIMNKLGYLSPIEILKELIKKETEKFNMNKKEN